MADLTYVLKKISAGKRVRIIQDRYGREHVEIPRVWLPIPLHIELSREEIVQVKAALGVRSGNRRTVPVTFGGG